MFTVVLVGFYAGGKTWFLNRVKHELGRWGFNLSPPPAPDRVVDRPSAISARRRKRRA